ncbi:phosphatidylinositol mannoside acyltransferase [Prauserella marina]|uniref:KDO2-lipid IV(A) lauroyltransferase n=1 Tax=Prauserella marina TaxID=530584 RepID=A0A222VSS6_9PSEU|nr:phosphatidylinositol mannoside acyltransferase [Prauserella marina]ASR36959.1 phosphatidylinositol mannoside acyltransferase [Prauserella marina]PWV80082.1 KDO2-lipid IV(A) lauroyltransferase [Prauserella marina]SDD83601.1 KDO2-lipid IV(A) lauroyltransferase [Prauserella marina]
MSSFAGRLADFGYATGWRVVPKLPSSLAASLFAVGADLAARKDGPSVRQLRKNLARVVPQADAGELVDLTRRAMRSYARYWHEAFWLPRSDHDAVAARVDNTGLEYLEAALEEGNGAVIALPHTGNWDAAGLWLVKQSGSFVTVAEKLEPPSLYKRFVEYRESLGFEVVPSDGSVSFRTLLRALRDNKVICLVGDRDMTRSGLPVTFFGEETRFPAGPARLAASTGAALLPAGTWFTEQGWNVRIHPRIRVNARDEIHPATQALADIFAADIAAHPTDWHMLQKFWSADRDAADADSSSGAG